MRCQVCQKNEVTMKITRIVDGVLTEYNVCQECGLKVSPNYKKQMKKSQVTKATVENLLKDLLSQDEGAGLAASSETIADLPTCSECGLDYGRFRKSLMLGCAGCYEAFGALLLADIEKIQGATQHVEGRRGGIGARNLDLQTRIMTLRRELDDAVQAENFERAVELRDRIRELQQTASATKGTAS